MLRSGKSILSGIEQKGRVFGLAGSRLSILRVKKKAKKVRSPEEKFGPNSTHANSSSTIQEQSTIPSDGARHRASLTEVCITTDSNLAVYLIDLSKLGRLLGIRPLFGPRVLCFSFNRAGFEPIFFWGGGKNRLPGKICTKKIKKAQKYATRQQRR